MSAASAASSARTSFARFGAWATRSAEAGGFGLSSLRLRFVVGSIAWCALILGLGYVALSALARQQAESAFEMERVEHLEELSRLVQVDAEGALALRAPLSDPRFLVERSGYYWEIEAADGQELRSRSLDGADMPFSVGFESGGVIRTSDAKGPNGQIRLYEQASRLGPSGQTVRMAVATDLRLAKPMTAAFEATARRILLFVALGLIVTTLVQAYVGFLPLGRLQRAIQKVRLGEQSRLPEDFPSELQPTVKHLNALLRANAAIIERSQVLAGNLAHSLKTPLSIIVDEASHLKADATKGDPDVILRKAERIRGIVDFQLARIRASSAQGGVLTGAQLAPVMRNVLFALARLHPGRVLSVEDIPDELRVACAQQDFEEMFANLVDNAMKWAKAKVKVRVSRAAGIASIVIEDDGPGMAVEDIERAFALGTRLDECVPGTGFGLAIVKELAESYGGRIELAPYETSGLRATLSLPIWA